MMAPAAIPAGNYSTEVHSWLESLAGAPLPSRRQEAWRFTDPMALTRLEPQLVPRRDPLADLTLPDGVQRLTTAEAAAWFGQALMATGCADHWPVLLNAGACTAGSLPLVALRVHGRPSGLEIPLDAAGGAGLAPFRLLLVMEAGAHLDLLLRPTTAAANGLSLVSEVILEPDAVLRLGSLALGVPGSCLLQHTAVLQAPGSRLEHTAVSGGWELARQEPRILQRAGAATTRLRGLQTCRRHQWADTHSWVRFDGPEGHLDQIHKAVADDRARSVFHGAVRVPRVAQRTQAAQLSRNLLLSDRARIDTKPELEIVADDVRCAHGATVSRLQTTELFYLQSRGIDAHQAARLLQRAFCNEVLRDLPVVAPSALAEPLLAPLFGEA